LQFSVNRHVEGVIAPPIVEVKRWATGDVSPCGKPYIDLCQAIPNYPPPDDLVRHLQGALPHPSSALYTADEGMLSVREAICSRYARRYGADLSPMNLCLTVGASQAFWLAMVTLCEAGDGVIVQTPYYFDYDMALEALGISRVYAPFDEDNGGLPNPKAIEALITAKTKAILLVSPCNPTGIVTPSHLIRELFELASAHGIALVLDETYADFIAGGDRPHDLFTAPDWQNSFIHIMSFGKSYAMTGYRAGLIAASPEFLGHALKVHDTMAICQPTPTQHALHYALDNLDDWVAENRVMMEERHDSFREEFSRPGNAFELIASGAFFAWVKHPFEQVPAWTIARELVERSGIISLPGEIFGPGMSRYLRVAFGNIKADVIPEAVARFRDFSR